MTTMIEGLVWEMAGTESQKRPNYPVKRLRCIKKKGIKVEYYWFTWYGLIQIIGREKNGIDYIDHVVEVLPEHERLIPYRK